MHKQWKVELHCHTAYSWDCRTALKDIIRTCQKKNIDKIAITDHNTAEGALQLAKMAPELIIVGEEIFTTEGEILAFFMRETIPPRLIPAETIKRLRDQDAFISVSHPYDRLRKGAWREEALLDIIDQVDALEVFNARCLYAQDNQRAAALAAKHNKLGTLGSDAHIPYEIGHATQLMPPFEGAGDFMAALRHAQPRASLSPFWVHGFSTLAKTIKKLQGQRRPD